MTSSAPDGAFAAMEQTGWERAAAGYDFFGQATRVVVPAVLRAARVREGALVLDVASGPGYLAAAAVRQDARAVAVDRSMAMTRRLRGSPVELPVVRADGMRLPFRTGVFDSCVAGFYLNHLDDAAAGLRELARVTRRGGWVATSIWDGPERARHTGLVAEAVDRVAGDRPPIPAPASPLPATGDGLRGLLAGAGLADPEVTQVSGSLVVTDSDELLAGLTHSTVRTAALLDRQPHRVQQRIRDELRELCEPYRRGPSELHVPVAALVLSGRR